MTQIQDSALARYWALLDAGDFKGCADQFAEHALYVRQTVTSDGLPGPLGFVYGRGAILAYFEQRGKQSFHHEIRRGVVDDGWAYAEGMVVDENGTPTMLFVSNASIDRDGHITRYLGLAKGVSPEAAAQLDVSPDQ
jgi:hypothetical protein